MALNPLGINVGTNSYINFDQQGTVNTQVVNIGTINGNLPGGSIAVTGVGSISSLGSLAMVNAGTISMLNAGTIGTVTGAGTVTNLGSVTNVGQVYNAGTLQRGTINTGTFRTDIPIISMLLLSR